MKQRILILQETLFRATDANAKLVFRIASQLREIGYDVSILGIAKSHEEHVDEYNGIHLIQEPANRVQDAQRLKERLGKWHRMRYLLMPRTIKYRYYIERYTPFYLEARRWLSRHVKEYDVLIACCSPYYPLQLAAEVAYRIPVIYYKIDPVASWKDKSTLDSTKATIKNEIVWDNVASRIIMTEVAYRDYLTLPTYANANKVIIAQFPNVRHISPGEIKFNVGCAFKTDKFNLLFVGKFYAKIRHPQYLFDLMEHLHDTSIVLHIIGSLDNLGLEKTYLEKYFTNQVPNIRYHGVVPPDEADKILLYADGLVHVGNNVDTAMPSKILDYISSGKPILNICKIRTCPTLPLIERYPLGKTIFEDEAITPKLVDGIRSFCMKNKGKQVPYTQIEKLYPECTIEYVGKQFDDTIQAAIKEFKQK